MRKKNASKTEIIKNNWKSRKDVIILDIETNWSEDWTEKGKRKRKFICGVIYSYNENKFLSFTDPYKFVEKVNKAKEVASYNGEGFDFLVIAKYGIKIKRLDNNRWGVVNKVSMDIMHTIQENRKNKKNKYPKLEEMMEVNFGKKKTKYNNKDTKEVIKHCKEDVKYTKKLYELKEWECPIIIRRDTSKGVWENDYDRDCYEGVSILFDGMKCPKCGSVNFDECDTIDEHDDYDTYPEMKPFECFDCGAVFDYDGGFFLE